MSFILDALKKSENERQRQVGPSLADMPPSRVRDDKPWWAVAVGVLLVVNLGVLLVVLMRDGDAKPAAAPAPQGTPMQAPNVPPQNYGNYGPPVQQAPVQNYPQQSYQPQNYQQRSYPQQGYQQPVYPQQAAPAYPSGGSLADEAAGGEAGYAEDPQNLVGAAGVPPGPPLVRQIDAPAVSPLPTQSVADARAAAAAGNRAGDVLPTISDIAAGGTSLPELHLDIHVHSQNAAERFVFVNMRKYVEGETLREGPVVERITPEGVVLNQRGLRFLLPRQ
jgi:general secretion pathway protein B